jgi:hypothetical protein
MLGGCTPAALLAARACLRGWPLVNGWKPCRAACRLSSLPTPLRSCTVCIMLAGGRPAGEGGGAERGELRLPRDAAL